jgi:hypothetical protein
VLDAIEEEVLCPDVIDTALREALDVLRRPAVAHPEHEATLKEELRGLEGQLANLTRAVKLGGALPSLVAELQAIERRRAEIHRTLKPTPATPVDVMKLRTMIADWALFHDTCRSPEKSFARCSPNAGSGRRGSRRSGASTSSAPLALSVRFSVGWPSHKRW